MGKGNTGLQYLKITITKGSSNKINLTTKESLGINSEREK